MIVNWELIIPVGMAVLGGVLSHQLAAWRDRANKRREYRVGYLIEVFRSIRKLSQQPQNDVLAAVEELDRLISDIQFLGNEEQIKAAIKLGEEVSKKRTADLRNYLKTYNFADKSSVDLNERTRRWPRKGRNSKHCQQYGMCQTNCGTR